MADGIPNGLRERVTQVERRIDRTEEARLETWRALAQTNQNIAVLTQRFDDTLRQRERRDQEIDDRLDQIARQRETHDKRRFEALTAFVAPIVTGVVVGAAIIILQGLH